VVGGFLVAVAAVVVFAAAMAGASSGHGRPWVVATRPMAAGTILGPGDLGTSSMRLPAATGSLAFGQVSGLFGRALTVGLQPGELVQSSMLAPSSSQPPRRPVSVPVDPVSLANLVPGQPVDVLAVAGSAGGSVSVVVRGATLMAIGRPGNGLLSSGDSSQATIGVTTLAEVEAVVAASHDGTVALVAAEQSDGAGPGPAAPNS
jgi:Flp pilus assembly protein CpaB